VALKDIPDPGFADDDGSADPRLSAALAAYADDPSAEPQVLSALTGSRLLVPVVPVQGGFGTAHVCRGKASGPDGQHGEKSDDMGVPTLQTADGRRALPAFTSVESLARWDPRARPIAVPLHQALRAAAHDQADTVVIDLAGPVPYQLTGPALLALAEGRESTDPLADPAVADALRAVLAGEPGVLAARLVPGGDTDGILALSLAPEAEPSDVARRVATALAVDETLRARLVRGLDLALLPPNTAVPGEPLYTREA
jgi:hypothetical protein